jgi:hypothetical protein
MIPKIMLEGGHAWVHERPIAALAATLNGYRANNVSSLVESYDELVQL